MMSKVKRYDIETDGFGNFSIGQDTSGRYVAFEDYAAMEQRAEAAEAKLNNRAPSIKRSSIGWDEETNGQTIPAAKVGGVADTEVQAGSDEGKSK